MSQIARFSTGGCVIHKIKIGIAPVKYSAWFDADGKMLDAEIVRDGHKTTLTVKKDGPVWNKLVQHYTPAYVKTLIANTPEPVKAG